MFFAKSILVALVVGSTKVFAADLEPVVHADQARPYLHIENTQPPGNMYVTHCTAMIDGNLFGCEDASSEPFKLSCDDKSHSGVETHYICNSAQITIDWDTLNVKFVNEENQAATCTLDKDGAGAGCYPEKDDTFPNCKAVATRMDQGFAVTEGSDSAHGAGLQIIKDGVKVGQSDDFNAIQNGDWVDVTSELPWVFIWKGSFHFNWEYCEGKYADQTDLKGTTSEETTWTFGSTGVIQKCEILFHC